MKEKFIFVCPYCQLEQHIYCDPFRWSYKTLTTCDTEQNGCGEDIALYINLSASVMTFKINTITASVTNI